MTFLRRIILAGLLLFAILLLIRQPLLRAAGRFLILDDPPEKADAIVVLSGSFPDRIMEAVTLYKDGYAPRIVLCREPPNAALDRLDEIGVHVRRGSELNRDVAERLGVPESAIEVVERAAPSTFSEARQVLRHARDRGYDSILLVTSKYHTKRAAWIYRYLAGDAIRIISRPAREDSFDPDSWWRHRASTRRVLVEYQKLLVFLLLDRWRVESPVSGSLFVAGMFARISHQPSAASADGHASQGRTPSSSSTYRSSMPPGASVRAALIHKPLHALATKPGEKCGLGCWPDPDAVTDPRPPIPGPYSRRVP